MCQYYLIRFHFFKILQALLYVFPFGSSLSAGNNIHFSDFNYSFQPALLMRLCKKLCLYHLYYEPTEE